MAHCLGILTFDILQSNYRFLHCRQVLKNPCYMDPKLFAGHDPLWIKVIPRPRRIGPHAIAVKPAGIEWRVAIAASSKIRERGAASLPDASRTRFVGKDAVDPCQQRGPRLEASKPTDHSKPSLLHHFLSGGAAPNKAHRKSNHRGMVSDNQRLKRHLIACLQARA